MTLNPKLTNAAASAEADAACALLNSGYLRIYDSTGAGQPTAADDAVTTQQLLAELRFAATAFQPAVNGVATANAIVSDPDALLTGTATWFRCLKSDGVTKVFDGSVGAADANLILNAVAIQQNAAVSVTAFTFTAQKG